MYPPVRDPKQVGTYPAAVAAGGGYVWDDVLEYRVWYADSPSDAYEAFASYDEALVFSRAKPGAEEPLALVLQEEYLDEPHPGHYVPVVERRLTEWPVVFLTRPRRTPRTIPDFMAKDAPANRLEVLRGTQR